MQITKGQRLKLSDIVTNSSSFTLTCQYSAPHLTLDIACFGLDVKGLLSDDRYMTFYNQPTTPCNAVTLTQSDTKGTSFSFDLSKLPATIERLVITAAVDGTGTMHDLQSGQVQLKTNQQTVAEFNFTGKDFQAERALMLMELYRKEGVWRIMANAQGFNGGLDALVKHFGASVAEPAAPVTPPATPPATPPNLAKRISLEKRLEQEAPQLLSLAKKSAVSLAKVGLDSHQARVCLCLDISGSMHGLYRSGVIQAFAERILALGCRFDDDGAIDVFLFGKDAHQPPAMGLDNYRRYIDDMLRQYPLEGDTRYGLAMQAIRRHYFPDAAGGQRTEPKSAQLPVYVMFLTDGSTSDQAQTEKQVRWSSYEPIFWQFMGIGKGRKSKAKRLFNFADSTFPFLEKLDELPNRFIYNADFFAVSSPDEHDDATLYDLLMSEYPNWVKLAQQKGLLRP
ncbi:MAG: VWA domain-containing protein [Thiolinea sp.]